jgi:DNA processing protein
MSEYSPMEPMAKWNFARRNRLISAISQITLIVQANQRSGTILTAKHAIEQGRPLGVVPSHPMDVSYAGSMYLISEGAYWVLSHHDIVSQFRSEVSYTDSGDSLGRTPLVDGLPAEF